MPAPTSFIPAYSAGETRYNGAWRLLGRRCFTWKLLVVLIGFVWLLEMRVEEEDAAVSMVKVVTTNMLGYTQMIRERKYTKQIRATTYELCSNPFSRWSPAYFAGPFLDT
jgi:hypothetical protein